MCVCFAADIMTGRITMPNASWKNITKEAKDAVKALLRVNPDARITLQQTVAEFMVTRQGQQEACARPT